MNQVIKDTPQDVINEITRIKGIYNIKIKCLACSESCFIPYKNMVVEDSKIVIGGHSFPVFMIEKVTIRYCYTGMKYEAKYKVSAKYLKTLLNEEVKKMLDDCVLL